MPANPHPKDPAAFDNSPRPYHIAPRPAQAQLESGDRLKNRAPLRPAIRLPGTKRPKNPTRHIHWASDVVDNEKKPTSRPKSPVDTKVLSKGSSSAGKRHTSSSNSKAAVANTSAKMVVPSQKSKPRSEQGHRPVNHHYGESKHRPHAESSKSRPSSDHTQHRVPPRVPDVPKTLKKAPPAPRPARLPTPDIPEIDGAMMFGPIPVLKAYFPIRDPRVRPAHQKMDTQMDAALKYMEERRRHGQ